MLEIEVAKQELEKVVRELSNPNISAIRKDTLERLMEFFHDKINGVKNEEEVLIDEPYVEITHLDFIREDNLIIKHHNQYKYIIYFFFANRFRFTGYITPKF